MASNSDSNTTRQRRMPPCVWCGGDRSGQVERVSYYTNDGDPLCLSCWDREYGESTAKLECVEARHGR